MPKQVICPGLNPYISHSFLETCLSLRKNPIQQCFSDTTVHTNPWGHLAKMQILIQKVLSGAWEFAFLTSFQVILIYLVLGPYSGKQGSRIPSTLSLPSEHPDLTWILLLIENLVEFKVVFSSLDYSNLLFSPIKYCSAHQGHRNRFSPCLR